MWRWGLYILPKLFLHFSSSNQDLSNFSDGFDYLSRVHKCVLFVHLLLSVTSYSVIGSESSFLHCRLGTKNKRPLHCWDHWEGHYSHTTSHSTLSSLMPSNIPLVCNITTIQKPSSRPLPLSLPWMTIEDCRVTPMKWPAQETRNCTNWVPFPPIFSPNYLLKLYKIELVVLMVRSFCDKDFRNTSFGSNHESCVDTQFTQQVVRVLVYSVDFVSPQLLTVL